MDNKYYGKIDSYTPVRKDGSRIVISYEMEPTGDGVHCTWYEVYLYHTTSIPTIDTIKQAVENDINEQVTEKIINGCVWNGIHIWLSEVNQINFRDNLTAAERNPELVLPLTFKIGQDSEGNPVNYQFTSVAELSDIVIQTTVHKNQCLQEGWARKDAIDWNDYIPVGE